MLVSMPLFSSTPRSIRDGATAAWLTLNQSIEVRILVSERKMYVRQTVRQHVATCQRVSPIKRLAPLSEDVRECVHLSQLAEWFSAVED